MNFIKTMLSGIVFLIGLQIHAQSFKISAQTIPVKASFRGLSAVNEQVAWASGSGGTVLKTTDGGKTWLDVSVPTADSIQFRDIEAFDSTTAIVMGVASPAKFYKTTNGGKNWKLVYQNKHPAVFFDAMEFWNNTAGIAFGDAIDGHLIIVTTKDSGQSWNEINYATLPNSPEGEGGFAASGTCLTLFGDSTVWIGLGSPGSRVFKSENRGRTWSVVETVMKRPKSTGGIFSLAFNSSSYGIAVGGDYEDDKNKTQNAALTKDGGSTWKVIEINQPNGYRSSVAPVPFTKWWIATGTSGVDLSINNGIKWQNISEEGFHAVSFGNKNIGWLSGSGKIAKLVLVNE